MPLTPTSALLAVVLLTGPVMAESGLPESRRSTSPRLNMSGAKKKKIGGSITPAVTQHNPTARPFAPKISVVRNNDYYGTIAHLDRTVTMTPSPVDEHEARRWMLGYLKTLRADGPAGRDVTVSAYVVPSDQHQTDHWYVKGHWMYNVPAPEIIVNAEAMRAVGKARES